MGPEGERRAFRLAFVDKLVAKRHERKARKREAKLLRQSEAAVRRSLRQIQHDERAKQEHQAKMPEARTRRRSLLQPPQTLHRASESHDTTLHRHTLHARPHVQTNARSTATTETPKPARSADETLHFSFSGGGWLMVYMYGVCKALRELKLEENAKFIGTSAGCLSVVSLVLGSDFDAICDSIVNDYVPAAHASLGGPFNMREYLVDAITRHAKIDNIHKLEDKVTVVYTSLSSWESRRVSSFKNPIHLLHTMVASCCATPLVGMPFWHEGEYVIDGGVLDNQPLFAGVSNILVSPNVFSDADIKPSRYVPAWWSAYPPSQRDMRWLYQLGYEDALSWAVRERFPGWEDVVVPTEAANYDPQWKTAIGRVVGYRGVEDAVLAVLERLQLSSNTTTYTFLRAEMLLWKLVAVAAAALDRASLIWTLLASATLFALVLLGQQHTLEFVLVAAAHASVALIKWRRAFMHVHGSEQWRLLQASVLAMGKHSAVDDHDHVRASMERVLTLEQHEVLRESSFVYRMSSSFM